MGFEVADDYGAVAVGADLEALEGILVDCVRRFYWFGDGDGVGHHVMTSIVFEIVQIIVSRLLCLAHKMRFVVVTLDSICLNGDLRGGEHRIMQILNDFFATQELINQLTNFMVLETRTGSTDVKRIRDHSSSRQLLLSWEPCINIALVKNNRRVGWVMEAIIAKPGYIDTSRVS